MWPVLKEAFTLPLGEGGFWKLLIGGAISLALEVFFVVLGYLLLREAALTFAPIALAANFPALGYAFRVFKASLEGGERKMPLWEGWINLTFQGVVLSLVGLGYGALPLTLIFIGLGLLIRGGTPLLAGMVVMVLGILSGLLAGFFLPIGLACYAADKRIEATFHLKQLWFRVEPILQEYLGTYLLCVTSLILAGMIGLSSFPLAKVSMPFLAPFLWAFLGPFLAFYLLLAWARLFGSTCAHALASSQPMRHL